MRASSDFATKVPSVTLGFWVAKVAATTLGETGGDTVTMTLNSGYLAGAVVLLVVLLLLIALQIRAPEFLPLLYWSTIVASTMFGTAMADYIDRSLDLGFFDGALLLLMALLGVPAPRSDGGRFPRQAAVGRGPCCQPTRCLPAARRLHIRLHFLPASKARDAFFHFGVMKIDRAVDADTAARIVMVLVSTLRILAVMRMN